MYRNYLSFSFTILATVVLYYHGTAQYFYKDIWNPKQLAKEMAALKNEKVKAITVKSFESDGEPSQSFFCEKKLNNKYTVSETITRSDVTSQSLLTTKFNENGSIITTTDSTESSVNRTGYVYNNDKTIAAVVTSAKADDDSAAIVETHHYKYDAKGTPEKMDIEKNGTNISTINFKTDGKGNIIEEDEVSKNGTGKKYFYYYDEKNNLTDVVHYNDRAKRLLPDYMYEYNEAGQLTQMVTTEDGGGNYYIWKYSYNDKNLRETEKCFSKERKLVGSVQYVYK